MFRLVGGYCFKQFPTAIGCREITLIQTKSHGIALELHSLTSQFAFGAAENFNKVQRLTMFLILMLNDDQFSFKPFDQLLQFDFEPLLLSTSKQNIITLVLGVPRSWRRSVDLTGIYG